MNITQYWWTVKTLRMAYKVKKETNFPASALTAQAILESYYGEKVPVDIDTGKVSNNLFGLKCIIKDDTIIEAGDNGWVKDLTREWDELNKEYYVDLAYFRAYNDYESCFKNYVEFIIQIPRYEEALKYLNDPKMYVYKLWKAGYATDPKYVVKVNQLIDQVNRIPVILLGGI